MTKIEKWALSLLAYSFFVSIVRHSLWLGINSMTLLVATFEMAITLVAFLPIFVFHKCLVTPKSHWAMNIPLALWMGYATFCMLVKIINLTMPTL